MEECDILLVIFPAQGHINPALQFAKRLIKLGIKVTLSTTQLAINRITNPPQGLTLAPFSHPADDHSQWKTATGIQDFMQSLKTNGSLAVADLIRARAAQGSPFSRVVYATLIPWVGQVARDLNTESTLLWVQPATLLDVYYYYFSGCTSVFLENETVDLPGLPLLSRQDLPSFLLESNPLTDFLLSFMKEHIELIQEQENPMVLVNSFDELEPKALNATEKLKFLAIGPLVPSALLGEKDDSDSSFGGDLYEKSIDYMEWLDSKPNSSIVYVSFGSYSELPKKQMEEIALGLSKSDWKFLWVIRGIDKLDEEKDEILKSIGELTSEKGLLVPWCSQVEVLSHPAVGCFVTHCGWNSTLESLVSGVPVVAFPLWTDQTTNAKLIQDVWRTGVRVSKNEEGLVEADEIKRCLEIVMGEEKGKEMRENGMKWRGLAKGAVKDDGSSLTNLRAFAHEIGGGGSGDN